MILNCGWKNDDYNRFATEDVNNHPAAKANPIKATFLAAFGGIGKMVSPYIFIGPFDGSSTLPSVSVGAFFFIINRMAAAAVAPIIPGNILYMITNGLELRLG